MIFKVYICTLLHKRSLFLHFVEKYPLKTQSVYNNDCVTGRVWVSTHNLFMCQWRPPWPIVGVSGSIWWSIALYRCICAYVYTCMYKVYRRFGWGSTVETNGNYVLRCYGVVRDEGKPEQFLGDHLPPGELKLTADITLIHQSTCRSGYSIQTLAKTQQSCL